MKLVPDKFQHWFAGRDWTLRLYQQKMVSAFKQKQATLLIAPTGSGKTLSGFLPSLIDLSNNPVSGLHTIYISPLKALTQDIYRNLQQPINEIDLTISLATRTGDTTAYQRQKQRKKPPNILLTTPESLMLMLSYADAPRIFSKVRSVIVDEAHSFAFTKRGDFTALALARLQSLSPNLVRFGLSATVANADSLAAWLGVSGKPCAVLQVKSRVKPDIKILKTKERMPFGGHMGKYAVKDIYRHISEARTTLVFVNTRAQAELIFQHLWSENVSALPIAIYHGSLSKEQRVKTEALMASGELRAIVATSALELGIDWGDIDLVIQVGAPKGLSRLLQRIGRSNHRMDEPSQALLVPANRFETLECQAAINAIKRNQLDGDPPMSGALDILPQFILNCACASPTNADEIYELVCNASPYGGLDRETFEQLWQFTKNGGYALQAYERYNRLAMRQDGMFEPSSKRVIMRHRQNIGTIVEAGRLRVKRLRRSHQGKIIGEVEEYFAQQLVPGDTFYFAGEVLRFEGIRDMMVEAKPAKAKDPKVPSYTGGQMPLSTFLADSVRDLLASSISFKSLPKQVRDWLDLQGQFSLIPGKEKILIEQFPYRQAQCCLFYTFEGRKANQTLGMLLTKRMEKLGLKPLSFSITDYGLSVSSIEKVLEPHLPRLFSPDILGDELEDWMLGAPMLKRSFRRVAVVSGLIEQQYHSTKKTMKQVTFSTDLIYDTLREHDPEHILLRVTREDAERELLDLQRLGDMLIRFDQKFDFKVLSRPSPMAIPIVLDVKSEQVKGQGLEALLEQANLYQEAENMMQEIKDLLGGKKI